MEVALPEIRHVNTQRKQGEHYVLLERITRPNPMPSVEGGQMILAVMRHGHEIWGNHPRRCVALASTFNIRHGGEEWAKRITPEGVLAYDYESEAVPLTGLISRRLDDFLLMNVKAREADISVPAICTPPGLQGPSFEDPRELFLKHTM